MSNEVVLDALDHAILDELQRDARLTNVELAQRVGLTPAPCFRRVKRLEAGGVIAGYRARLDPTAMGRAFWVYVSVELQISSSAAVEEFEAAVSALDEVAAVCRMYGPVDYLLRVEVRDSAAYEQFQSRSLYALPHIRRVTPAPTMKVVKAAR